MIKEEELKICGLVKTSEEVIIFFKSFSVVADESPSATTVVETTKLTLDIFKLFSEENNEIPSWMLSPADEVELTEFVSLKLGELLTFSLLDIPRFSAALEINSRKVLIPSSETLTPIGLSEEMFSVVVLLRNTSEVSLLMSA
jgi:hypothetical protein